MSTLPSRLDLAVWAGNTWSQPFQMEAADVPLDLTGSKLVWRMVYGATITRKSTDDADSGIEITDAAEGEFRLYLTVTETRLWPDGSVVRYEVERWIDDDQVTMIYGTMTVTAWVNDDADPS